MIRTVVWGTGNVGRAAIRAVAAHPALDPAAVVVHDPAKVGRDAGDLAGLDHGLGVAATTDVAAVLGDRPPRRYLSRAPERRLSVRRASVRGRLAGWTCRCSPRCWSAATPSRSG